MASGCRKLELNHKMQNNDPVTGLFGRDDVRCEGLSSEMMIT